jgi:hypothetical protein
MKHVLLKRFHWMAVVYIKTPACQVSTFAGHAATVFGGFAESFLRRRLYGARNCGKSRVIGDLATFGAHSVLYNKNAANHDMTRSPWLDAQAMSQFATWRSWPA